MNCTVPPTLDPLTIHFLRQEQDDLVRRDPKNFHLAEVLGMLDRWDATSCTYGSGVFRAPFHEEDKAPLTLRQATERAVDEFRETVRVDGSAISQRGDDSIALSCSAFTTLDMFFAGTSMLLRNNRTLGLMHDDLTALLCAPRRILEVLDQDPPLRSAIGRWTRGVLGCAPPKDYDPMLSVYVRLMGT